MVRAVDLGGQALDLCDVPGALPCRGLELSRDGALDIVLSAPIGREPGLGRVGSLEAPTRFLRDRRRSSGGLICELGLDGEAVDLGAQAFGLRPPLERGVATSQPDRQLGDECRSVARRDRPARRQHRLQLQRG